MVIRPHIAIPLALVALSACGENDRREFIYKPAYCLAGGLAALSSEACLPEKLKENAAAVATAKMKDAAAETPGEDVRVYYTDDQRNGISYTIARQLFAPDAKLTKSSITMSLEASNIIERTPLADMSCGQDKARHDVINYVNGQVTETMVNRETATFLADHYTDLQLTELYRVAKSGGTIDAVKDDAFIMPDPKNASKTVNVKPKNGHELGGIISYATSRVASRLVDERRAAIDTVKAEAIAQRKAKACPPKEPEPEPVAEPVAETAPETAPEATETAPE